MKGKIGLVVGLGVGYVLGTRAGRERYEQIKTQWLKVWHLDPVQEQVERVKGYVGDKAAAVPGALWNGVVKIAKSAGNATKNAADDVARATEEAVNEAEKTEAKSTSTKSTSTKSTAPKSTASKSPASKSAASKSTASKSSASKSPAAKSSAAKNSTKKTGA